MKLPSFLSICVLLCLAQPLLASPSFQTMAGAQSSANRSDSSPATADESVALTQALETAAKEPQSLAASEQVATDQGPLGIVPLTRGFNASLGTTSQHDSTDGWSSLLTPDVAYRYNQYFSVNAGVPVFTYINVTRSTTVKTGPLTTSTTTSLVTRHLLLGDATIAAELDLHPHRFDYNLTATLGLPTGDDANGLGAGQGTYAFVNHFERSFGDIFTPEIELGIGDSPNLDDTRIRRSYTVVGESAHFQAGLGVSLPFNMNFESDAYEELPLSAQTVTSTTTRGKKGKTTTKTSQESLGEDNGFTNTLDIPLNGHITLSGFYNRSLRNKIDTAGFSLTFLLRAPPHKKD